MKTKTDFVKEVVGAFRNIIKEIEKGSSEHDIRYRFVKYFVEGVLGYKPKHIKWEKKRADLTIVDENDFSVIKIETKRPSESIDKTKHEEQAFKYVEETTKYIGLTNFLHFKLWEVKKTGSELRVDLDFSELGKQRKLTPEAESREKEQILFLNNLTKETLFDPSKYEEFDENYARIDITKERGFNKLLDRLNFIANNLLFHYTLKAFGEYKEGYAKYQEEITKTDNELNNNDHKWDVNHSIVKYRQKIEEKYEKYKPFSGFELWKHFSGKEDLPDTEVKEIFCKETIYVFLNKLLLLRTCEDKGLLEKSISNGGIEQLREVYSKRYSRESVNKEIIETAFKSGKSIYSHFYETGILDWFRTGDGELNDKLNQVLWILNQFDFTHVDRDILGNLYEKYLPPKERKKLGEFYTPVEVVDYILTSVGYTYSYEIENKELLDPACGSGSFLVRATRRLISRYLMKFGKTNKKELRNPKKWKEIVERLSPDEAKIILDSVHEHIYGLDINPFACHIAEMNMLIQTIDLFHKARKKHKDYRFGRFKIYRTDSLELLEQKPISDFGNNLKFLEEQEEIDTIKRKKFDFVVGNPPYVRQEKIKSQKKYYKKNYPDIYSGRADLYVYFIRRGISWVKEKGKLGYIVSGKFIKTGYGKYIRAYLVTSTTINAIIDLRSAKVFKEATNDPIILSLTNKKPSDNTTSNIVILKKEAPGAEKSSVLKGTINEIFRAFGKKLENQFVKSYQKNQKMIAQDLKHDTKKTYVKSWDLTPPEVQSVRKKVLKHPNKRLQEICDIYRGIRTGANEIFVINQKDIESYRIESKLLKKLIKGKDVKKWSVSYRGLYIIYTNLPSVDVKEYSNTFAYLSRFKDRLEKRAQYKQRKKRGEDMKWYEIEQPLSASLLEGPKIVTQRISNQYGFAFDDGIFYTLETCSTIIPKNQNRSNTLYLLGILNSSLMEFFTKTDGKALGKGGYEFEKQFLDRLPIKLPETKKEEKIAEKIVGRVEEILKLHEKGISDMEEILKDKEVTKLYDVSGVSFSMRDDAKFEDVKVKGNKIFINSQDYIKVEDKKVMDFVAIYLNSIKGELSKEEEVKNLIYNLKVPKDDEVLGEIIKGGKVDQNEIKERVEKSEQEINDLVYEIYGISDKEREIIERAISL